MNIKKIMFIFALMVAGFVNSFAQNVTITDDSTHSAHISAMLDVYSTSKGFLLPRLSSSQRSSISYPASGLIVFDTDSTKFYFYNGSAWVSLMDITDTSNSIWKEDASNQYVYLNESLRKVGIGQSNPEAKLVVKGDSVNNSSDTIPLFSVKDRNGNEVFVVYPRGVMVYVDTIIDTSGYKDNVTTSVTGFRVGKKTGSGSKGFDDEYFTISPSGSVDTLGSQARILWYPLKEAFLSGRIIIESPDSVGFNSWASGYLSKSIGDYSQALGYSPKAVGNYSTAIGNYALALGDNSFALGDSTVAGGGGGAKAASNNCYAFGKGSEATGDGSYAFGKNALSTGTGSFAFGDSAQASGNYAVAFGRKSSAENMFSYAFGENASAGNDESYAFGRGATALGFRSFAFGSSGVDSAGNPTAVTKALGSYSLAMGQGSISEGNGTVSIGVADTARGNYALAMGYKSRATGYASTAIGFETNSTNYYSMAFGYKTHASGQNSTALGFYCNASGYYSTALGSNTNASGSNSTAIGAYSSATNTGCIAMGWNTLASGPYSTAIGSNTIAPSYLEIAMGRYNTNYTPDDIYDWDLDDRLFVIGNGDPVTRKNAFLILKNGKICVNSQEDPHSYFQVNGAVANSIITITSTTNLSDAHHTVLVNNTSPVTVYLPQTSLCNGRIYIIKKISSGTSTVTINPYSSELIEGNATRTIQTQYETLTVQCNGAAWYIIN